MLIEELCKCVNEDSSARITKVLDSNGDLVVQLEMNSEVETETRLGYQLQAIHVVESDICPRWIGEINFTETHQVLWNYKQQWYELYYTSPPLDRLKLLGAIYDAHERIMGDWRPLSEYLNSYAIVNLGSNGLLARGPESIITAYVAAIEHLLNVNTIQCHRRPNPAKALLVGDAFAICSDVTVSEIAVETNT